MRNARKAEAEGSESGVGDGRLERKEFTLYRTSVTAVAFIALSFQYPLVSFSL